MSNLLTNSIALNMLTISVLSAIAINKYAPKRKLWRYISYSGYLFLFTIGFYGSLVLMLL